MRIRRAVLAATLAGTSALSLGACTSSGDTFTPPSHSASVHSTSPGARSADPSARAAAARKARLKAAHLKALCTGLVDAGNKITAAEKAFYTRSGSSNLAVVRSISHELHRLEGKAPKQIKPALHDMVDVFQSFGNMLANPSSQNSAQVAALGRRLTADGTKVSRYVSGHCPAS